MSEISTWCLGCLAEIDRIRNLDVVSWLLGEQEREEREDREEREERDEREDEGEGLTPPFYNEGLVLAHILIPRHVLLL
ncbi:hypothetical protein Sjap_008178 [Stephania japonica]|uniref:Uncharacterized protein n=1 Tax=Stephania japonica TaxID=461633 RepID=A0AAP0JPN3_9MAGN